MRITDCDNLSEGLEPYKVKVLLYDKCEQNTNKEYDATLYVQFKANDIQSSTLSYAILFNTDYYKNSDEMHKLIVTLVREKCDELCDNAVKEYLFKVQGFVFGCIYENGTVINDPYKLVNACIKYNTDIIEAFKYENN